MAHSERKHATWSGSQCHVWRRCHGRTALLDTMPASERKSTSASLLGEAAHEVLELSILHNIRGGLGSPEIARSVAMVLEYVDEIKAEYPDVVIKCELDAPFPQSVVSQKDCRGIIDIAMYSFTACRGWIIDYKHGVMPVPVWDNDQLWFGAAAAFYNQRDEIGKPMPIDRITLAIVQPNTFGGETEKPHIQEIHAYDLIDFVADVEDALRANQDPDAKLTPGDHCQYCPAEAYCLAREAAAMRDIIGFDNIDSTIAGLKQTNFTPKKSDMTPYRLSVIMAGEDSVKSWFKACRVEAFRIAMLGIKVPGKKLVLDNADRQWDQNLTTEQIVERLALMSDFELGPEELLTPPKLKALTVVEEMLAAAVIKCAPEGKKRQAVVETRRDFAFLTPKGASKTYKLVPETDPRPAASPVATQFAGVSIDQSQE